MVVDLPHSGRPSMSTNDENINKIEKLVLKNRRTILEELYQEGYIFISISYRF